MMDIVYPLAVIAAALLAHYLSHTALDLFSTLLLGSIGIWGVRLAVQTYRQNMHAERQPYAHWRAKYGRRWLWWSAFQIHLLQAGMIWLWVAPIVFALGAPLPRPIALAALGTGVWLLGFALEAIADRQLTAFRLDPAQRGKLLDRGVWSYVRHPNYLGEAVMWCGWFLFALAHPWGWITVFAPLFNGWFMGYASAAPYKEQHMARTRGDAWAAYCARTPRFIPWPRVVTPRRPRS
jgi:steroid 5-alpha reductase family enzyme